MNILHLLSQNHLTGAEVYAVTLAHQQMDLGHRVYQLSNGFYFQSRTIRLQLEVETKSKLTFIKNILWLRNFIRKQDIHIIHTHSRAAAKLAYWATLFTNTAQVSTVHGVQHFSYSKKLHNQYGQFIIAVCENIKNHLIQDFSYNPNRIKTLRNPINPTDFFYFANAGGKKKSSNSTLKLAIVGRTTGPKKERTEQVLNALAQLNHQLGHQPNIEITLIGGQLTDLSIDATLKGKIKEINSTENSTPVKLNSTVYANYDLVIGSGRVCMESLITGVPTIAFGEARYIGLITEKNFFTAVQSNFGDIHPESKHPQINWLQFAEDIQNCLTKQVDPSSKQQSLALFKLALSEFSLDSITKKVLRVYESAYFLKNYKFWIPILMYHKIPDKEISSKHKIYVTKSNFEKHLQFFYKRGFKTLTFSDLQQFRTGKRKFSEFPKKPLILTFDDGYKDTLENASPLLKKYNFKAQVFLLADTSVKQNFWDIGPDEPVHEIVSGAERIKWKESAFEVGSHGFLHEKITEFQEDTALNELTASKQALEKEFGLPLNVFAFTYGITNSNSSALAQKAGYDYAVNVDSGGFLIEEDPYSIFRVNIFPDENLWSLYKKTSRWYRKYYHYKRKK